MTRTQRLFELVQILRTYRYPATAAALAATLEVSVRTLYRDILTLQQQGVDIQGSAGLGYILKSAYQLPPLMFTRQEMDALMLGLNWLSRHTDTELKSAGRDALAKIQAVIPCALKAETTTASLLTGPAEYDFTGEWLVEIRQALRQSAKVEICYQDKDKKVTTRVIWPIALGYMESGRLLIGWCELRAQFRHFSAERIKNLVVLSQIYPVSRPVLLKKWQARQGISSQ